MNEKNYSSLSNSVLSGAISGAFTALALQPLEYIKTKLQQPQFAKTNELSRSGKRNIKFIFELTLKNEKNQLNFLNAKKFWTGVTPSLMRSVPVAAFYFGSVDFLRNSSFLSHSQQGGQYQLLHSFLIGVISRVMADVSTHPLNLIKTRYESENYKYGSISNAFRSIWIQEGFRGLFKGLIPTLLRDITYSGLYYPLYTKIKFIVRENLMPSKKVETLYFASCAFLSSLLACAITQPPDVIRSYVQLSKKHINFSKAAQQIYKKNGLRGFFAGFVPRSARRIMISVFSWTLYEKFSIRG
ncbi:unnamed protein product [Brachionus calyciflorus]|uniref:Solute carrier family 25 member 38 homolog n=1 Tax=Brachionus calyciflorus TaxID=104777 RepID=A0A813X5S3_9BILA|nr:unnamed protein product [Brachionus calyciflorus]